MSIVKFKCKTKETEEFQSFQQNLPFSFVSGEGCFSLGGWGSLGVGYYSKARLRISAYRCDEDI